MIIYVLKKAIKFYKMGKLTEKEKKCCVTAPRLERRDQMKWRSCWLSIVVGEMKKWEFIFVRCEWRIIVERRYIYLNLLAVYVDSLFSPIYLGSEIVYEGFQLIVLFVGYCFLELWGFQLVGVVFSFFVAFCGGYLLAFLLCLRKCFQLQIKY